MSRKRVREESDFVSDISHVQTKKPRLEKIQITIPHLLSKVESLKNEIIKLRQEAEVREKELKNCMINLEQRISQRVFEELNKFLYPKLPPLDSAHNYFT